MVGDLAGTKGWKKVGLAVVVVNGIMTPMSRMALGLHAADQVVNGVLNSLAAVVLYRFLLQKQRYKLMKNSLSGKHFIATTIALALSLAIPILLYEVNTRYRQFDQSYIDRFMQTCRKTTTYFSI